MIAVGVPRDNIHVQPEASFYAEIETGDEEPAPVTSWTSRLGWLFTGLARSHVPPGAEGTYRDAIRRGSTVIVIHVSSAEEALEAATLMTENGAFDVEHCRTYWKAR